MANTIVRLDNVELQWACFNATNDMSDKYQVDLVNLSPENVEKLESLGLVARFREDKPDKGRFIVPKSIHPIVPVRADGSIITDAVGNGSRATVLMTYYIPKRKPVGAPERSPSLVKITVNELLVYNKDAPTAISDADL